MLPWGCTALKKAKRVGVIFVAAIVAAIVVTVLVGYWWFDNYYQDRVLDGSGGLFEATATMLALFSLGSVLGSSLSARLNRDSQAGLLYAIIICGMVVIVLHAVVMIWLCCFELLASTYVSIMVATVICFIVIAVFAMSLVSIQAPSTLRAPPAVAPPPPPPTRTQDKAPLGVDSKPPNIEQRSGFYDYMYDLIRSDVEGRVRSAISKSDKIDPDISYDVRFDSGKFEIIMSDDVPEYVKTEIERIFREALKDIPVKQ